MTARWIAFEGCEATGKSTQAQLLASRLDAIVTREPGGTVVGERVRELLLDRAIVNLDPRAETLLMAADRAQHIVERVRPALRQNRTVVSDRSAYSSLAYQGYGRGLGVEEVRSVCNWATTGLWPDVAILLDVPREERVARTRGPQDRMEAAGSEFHARVEEGFRALAAADPDRWLVVDGVGTVQDVARRVAGAYQAWVVAHG